VFSEDDLSRLHRAVLSVQIPSPILEGAQAMQDVEVRRYGAAAN